MAISAYTGLPGSGKSYEVVNSVILRAVQRGRVVWTNIPVLIDGVKVFQHDPENPHWYLDAPGGAVVVIDECWRYWPSGTKANEIAERIGSFFAEHRHRTGNGEETEIVLVTQDLSQIASSIRTLVSKTYRMRKLIELGLGSRYRVDVYSGAVTGQRPPAAQHVSGWRAKYDPEGFKRYKSHTQGDEAKAADADARGTVWRRVEVLAIPLLVVGLFFIVPGVTSALGAKDKTQQAVSGERSDPPRPVVRPQAQQTPQTPETSQKQPEAAPEPQASTGPKESKRWALIGVATTADGHGVAYLDSATGRRRIPADLCSRNDVGDWTCVLDGELVAMWTGNGALRMVQASTYNDRSQ